MHNYRTNHSGFPDFIIGGAAKCATTSLARYLSSYPEIAMPDHELNYFAFASHPFRYKIANHDIIRDQQGYLDTLREISSANTVLVGEKSVSYVYRGYYERTIANIKAHHPAWESLKWIFVLRHPADRAYSQHTHNSRFHERLRFSEAIEQWPVRKEQGWIPAYDYFGAGFYSEAIQAYTAHFSNVRIYLFEDLVRDAEPVLKDIMAFLGEVPFDPQYRFPHSNISYKPKTGITGKLFSTGKKLLQPVLGEKQIQKIRPLIQGSKYKKPDPDPAEMRALSARYIPEIKKLEKVIDRDLSLWLSKWK